MQTASSMVTSSLTICCCVQTAYSRSATLAAQHSWCVQLRVVPSVAGSNFITCVLCCVLLCAYHIRPALVQWQWPAPTLCCLVVGYCVPVCAAQSSVTHHDHTWHTSIHGARGGGRAWRAIFGGASRAVGSRRLLAHVCDWRWCARSGAGRQGAAARRHRAAPVA